MFSGDGWPFRVSERVRSLLGDGFSQRRSWPEGPPTENGQAWPIEVRPVTENLEIDADQS